ALVRPISNMSARLHRSSEHCGFACAAPLMNTGLLGMSFACAAEETTNAPAPSDSRQQSSRWNGSKIGLGFMLSAVGILPSRHVALGLRFACRRPRAAQCPGACG